MVMHTMGQGMGDWHYHTLQLYVEVQPCTILLKNRWAKALKMCKPSTQQFNFKEYILSKSSDKCTKMFLQAGSWHLDNNQNVQREGIC